MSTDLLPAVDVAGGQAVRLVQGAAGVRDVLRRPARGRARLAVGRRGVDPPGRPGRRLRPRLQRATCSPRWSASSTSRSSCPAASATTSRLSARWPPAAPGSTSARPRWRSPDWVREIIAAHGDKIAVGLDVRGRTLAARGWTREGGDLYEALDRLDAEGCARYVITDVLKDGMLRGPNLDLYRDVCARTDAPVVASGGVSSLDDLRALAAPGPARRRGRDRRQGPLRGRVHPRPRPSRRCGRAG